MAEQSVSSERKQKTAVKLPPHAAQAEIGLLGCLLMSPTSIDKVVDILQAQDFYQNDQDTKLPCLDWSIASF